jgi:hypothetical protein
LANDGVGAALATTAKIEVTTGIGHQAAGRREIQDFSTIAAFIRAIGPAQNAVQPVARCKPTVVAKFVDAQGAALGSLSLFCGDTVKALATFVPAAGSPGGITLADPESIERVLGSTGAWHPPSAPPPARCGAGGMPVSDFRACVDAGAKRGVLGGSCCYQTKEQACSGLSCPGKCSLQKSFPPQAFCEP